MEASGGKNNDAKTPRKSFRVEFTIINLLDIASKWEVESFKWRYFTHSCKKSCLRISNINKSMMFRTNFRLKALFGEAYFRWFSLFFSKRLGLSKIRKLENRGKYWYSWFAVGIRISINRSRKYKVAAFIEKSLFLPLK